MAATSAPIHIGAVPDCPQVLTRLGNQTAAEWLTPDTTPPTDVLKRIAGPRLLWQVRCAVLGMLCCRFLAAGATLCCCFLAEGANHARVLSG